MIKLLYICLSSAFLLFILTPSSMEAAVDTKRQWQDESVYYLLVDRFFNGDYHNDYFINTKEHDAYHGGDFQGMMTKLDYIHNMGFTTIRLDVIFDQERYSPSGQFLVDPYTIEEHYGNLKTFKQLVKKAHERDMKVMIDFPIATLQGMSENDMIMLANWWKDQTGIDGYFLPNLDKTPQNFLERFISELKYTSEVFYLVGEVEQADIKEIENYENMGLTSIIISTSSDELRNIFQSPNHLLEAVLSRFVDQKSYYVTKNIDRPGKARFTNHIVQSNQFPGDRWKPALSLLYTTPGVPMIYYGSEIALIGGGVDNDEQMLEFRADQELIEFIEKLGKARNQYRSLTRGDYQIIFEQEGIAVYTRSYLGEKTVIAINNTSKHQTIEIPATDIGTNKQLLSLIEGGLIKEQNGTYFIPLNEEQSDIYIVRDDYGLNIYNILIMIAVPVSFLILFYAIWKKGRKKRV